MEPRRKERWQELAEQLSKEENTQEMLRLSLELDQILAEKEVQNNRRQGSAAA
jgi:hypothetical protein